MNLYVILGGIVAGLLSLWNMIRLSKANAVLKEQQTNIQRMHDTELARKEAEHRRELETLQGVNDAQAANASLDANGVADRLRDYTRDGE